MANTNATTITLQHILDALNNPPDGIYIESSNHPTLKDGARRPLRIVTISDAAINELKTRGLTVVEHIDGEMHNITFSNADGSKSLTIGVPSRTNFKWGTNGPIKHITDLKELENTGLKSDKKASLDVSESIKLASANHSEVTVPNVPNRGAPRQV